MDIDTEASVATVLCYGDSNTWGFIPGAAKRRYPGEIRWPGVLARLLGDSHRVVEEGLPGRTTAHDDPLEGGLTVDKNGLRAFGGIMESHSPVDVVVVMLGTSDLKRRFASSAMEIAAGVEQLVKAARNPEFGPGLNRPPKILVVCPPSIWEVEANHGPVFKGGRDISLDLPMAFHQMSTRISVPVLYADKFLQSDPMDGIHLSADSHAALAGEIASWITEAP